MHRRKQSGQAILIVVMAVSLLLIGALGLVMDGAQIYTNRQMAQLAADAAAEAGIMSVYGGTNTGANNTFGASTHTCTTSDSITPCQYARFNGFGSTAADTVVVDFPSASAVGVDSSKLSGDSPNIVRVTITRTLNTGLMRLLGASTATVKAIGAAAILNIVQPIPILVLQPSNSGSFALNGGPNIVICGGPARSIQVNSSSPTAVTLSGNSNVVNLSKAGPKDDGQCTSGTGADFAVVGPEASYPRPVCATGCSLDIGTTGHYLAAVVKQQDPFKGITQPSSTGLSPGTSTVVTNASSPNYGCPCSSGTGKCFNNSPSCTVYTPGIYASGIQVKNDFAIFTPGLYYISGGGFSMDSNSNAVIATGVSGSGDFANNGMMMFFTGSAALNITSNAGANAPGSTAVGCPSCQGGSCSASSCSGINLNGSDTGGTYKNILFFEDRNAAANTHRLGGGGSMTLNGTIYLTNGPSYSQTLQFQGGSGSSTLIEGEIIVDQLGLGGGGNNFNIRMNLNAGQHVTVRQVALVH